MTYDDDLETYDFREDDDEPASDFDEVLRKLRDTLTADMAIKAYRIRYEREPSEDELLDFMEELVSEHYNAGLDEWTDEYLYYD